jgi:hypothetical protein
MCQLCWKVSGNWGSCGFGRRERNCRNQVRSDNAIMAIFRACTSEMWAVVASDNTLLQWVSVLRKGGLVPGVRHCSIIDKSLLP